MGEEQPYKQAKRWKDMSTGERTTGVVSLFILALLVVFIAKLVIPSGGSNPPASDASSTVQPAQPSTAQQVASWYNQYGSIIQTFGADASKTAIDGKNGNVSLLGIDCVQMQNDIKKAQGLPAIPDPQTASDFSSAMSYYADGAQDCIDGATTYDASLLSKAAQEITQGNSQIGVAGNDIKKLVTN